MKKLPVIILGILVSIAAIGQSQNSKAQVISAVKNFVEGGDNQDVKKLASLLHESHRLVWNDGKKDPFIADKSYYLSKIDSKEWGGDTRILEIESIELNGEVNAKVKAKLTSDKMEMHSFYSLVKVQNDWKIIEDLVSVSFKTP